MRLKATGSLITGILLLILGIILTITLNSPKSLILSGIGILAILFVLLQFKLAKKSIQGRL
ncbi:MAG TPA: hypothetical protein VJB89_02200 [Candidatus Nanoarchaeia archaeon]|nr:hypothetical protein [Candidatus Nanoarchaeia archaeon]